MHAHTIFQMLAAESEGHYQESGSKFFAYAFPVHSKSEVEDKLHQLKQVHPRARHFCYAYRLLGKEEITEYGSDAGEPSGSAGAPILNAMRSGGLVNSAVVVVRYFGGTKLGIPGLIHAYRESAHNAIVSGGSAEVRRMQQYQIEMPLQLQPVFFHAAKHLDITIDTTDYSERFRSVISVPLEESEVMLTRLIAQIAGREGDLLALAQWMAIEIEKQ